jgi:WD40 repeat protein
LLLGGSSDNTARVWNAATGVEIASFTHDGPVSAVGFSPDGKWVISASGDNTSRIWEVATKTEAALIEHDGAVSAVAFSPDGKEVISGSVDKTVRVWSAGPHSVRRLNHHRFVLATSFSPDGSRIASGAADNIARVWDPAAGEEIARLQHNAPVSTVVFSPDGRFVVSGSEDKTARLWNAATGVEIARVTHDTPVSAVAFSPNGKWVLSGGNDGQTRVWQAATGQVVARMNSPNPIRRVSFGLNDKTIVTAGDSDVSFWGLEPTKLKRRVTFEPDVEAMLISPDRRWFIVRTAQHAGGLTTGLVRIWDLTTAKEVWELGLGSAGHAIAISPDDSLLATSSGFTAQIWKIATLEKVAQIDHGNFIMTLAFSPDGNSLLSSGGDLRGGEVRLWRLNGESLGSLAKTPPFQISFADFSKSGRWLSVTGLNTISIYSLGAADIVADSCQWFWRHLTLPEWRQYLGADDYATTCTSVPWKYR